MGAGDRGSLERVKPEWKQWGLCLGGALAWIGILVLDVGERWLLLGGHNGDSWKPSIFGFTLLGWLATSQSTDSLSVRSAFGMAFDQFSPVFTTLECLALSIPLILEETQPLLRYRISGDDDPFTMFSESIAAIYRDALLLLYPLTES